MIRPDLNEYQVIGWENGGIEIVHIPCDTVVAEGGCDCCPGNAVTVQDILRGVEAHTCEKRKGKP